MPTALFWALLFFTSNLYANPKYTFESIPNPTLQNLYISNPDNILNENDSLFIYQTLKSSDTKDFAVRLFNHWGIGKKGKDNGLLILLITEKRRVEIEVGYGLEGIITDLNANRVIQNSMIPSLKEAQYSEAIRKALNDIEELFINWNFNFLKTCLIGTICYS